MRVGGREALRSEERKGGKKCSHEAAMTARQKGDCYGSQFS
jgi:hypothetical protein